MNVESLFNAGLLRELDVHALNALVRRFAPDSAPSGDVQAILALAIRVSGDGHVCLDLQSDTWWQLERATPNDDETRDPGKIISTLPPPNGAEKLLNDCTTLVGDDTANLPFVLHNHRLYLRRFWNYEKFAAEKLLALAGKPAQSISKATQQRLDSLTFGDKGQFSLAASQKQAILKGLENRLTIITGGPGTGKTTIAAILLKLLGENAGGKDLRVRMTAPSGKAAARLQESVRAGIPEASRGLEMEPASTIERLLGYQRNSPYFLHTRKNPLATDILLVDETSMVDLSRMAKLLDALPATARLILLGDKNQLASVDPGSVMAEICEAEALKNCVVELTESKRFDADSAVTPLSQAVRAAKADEAWEILSEGAAGVEGKKVSLHRTIHEFTFREYPDDFAALVRERYRAFCDAKDPRAAFDAFAQFRVLCALRRGATGVDRINRLIEDLLFPSRRGDFYDHRPILVTKNDYEVQLFNGDIGIILPDENGKLMAHFETRATPLPTRLLPEHETAFAMTVHKAQGSGFHHVAVLLPAQDSPILTRELIYTAITRTETGVDLWCEEEAFKSGILKATTRSMGLKSRLDTL